MKGTSGHMRLKKEYLEDLKLNVPEIEVQKDIIQEIESKFSIIDSLEKTVNDNLKRVKVLRQATLKKAFEGRLVPQDPNDEPASKLLERITAEKEKEDKGTKRS